MTSSVRDSSASAEARYGSALLRLGRWEAVAVPLAIYVVARLLSALALVWAAASQPATETLARASDPLEGYFAYEGTPAHPGYGQLLTNWDGQWYQLIATEGYTPAAMGPTPVESWAWAFPPGYPMIVRSFMQVSGLPFTFVGPTLSLVLGGAAMVVLYATLRRRGGWFLAVTGVATTSFFVSAPLLQAAYSESLALLLLASVFWALGAQRWWLATTLEVALAFVRLVTPPLALVGLFVIVGRVRAGSRSPRDLAGPITFSTLALAGPFLWSSVSRVFLGSGEGRGAVRAASQVGNFGFGFFGVFANYAPIMLVPLAVMVLLLVRVMVEPRQRFWGLDVQTWGWAYPLFVMVVTSPMTGFLRYLLLAFPLGLPVAGDARQPTRARIWALVALCLALQAAQVVWVKYVFVVDERSLIP